MQNFFEDVRRWYGAAEQERAETYAFLGLDPIKKPFFLHANTWIAQMEKRLEEAHFLRADEVNFLNAYTSWYDFFNDVKATVVKPLVVLWLSMKHTHQMFLDFFVVLIYSVRGQEGYAREFEQEVTQSFLKAIIYAAISWKWMVVYAQVLSMASRILMSIPSLVTSCRRDGCGVMARRSGNGLAEGFYSMFSSRVQSPVSNADRTAAMREARERAFG